MTKILFFSVPPSKPRIALQPESGSGNVEGYLGPYLIGTRLSLSCQVFGGEYLCYILIQTHIYVYIFIATFLLITSRLPGVARDHFTTMTFCILITLTNLTATNLMLRWFPWPTN